MLPSMGNSLWSPFRPIPIIEDPFRLVPEALRARISKQRCKVSRDARKPSPAQHCIPSVIIFRAARIPGYHSFGQCWRALPLIVLCNLLRGRCRTGAASLRYRAGPLALLAMKATITVLSVIPDTIRYCHGFNVT